MNYKLKLSVLLIILSTTALAYDVADPIILGRSYWCNNGNIEYAVTVSSDASQATIVTHESETVILNRSYNGTDIISFDTVTYGGITLSIWPNKQLSIIRFAKGNTDNMIFQCK